MQLDTSYKIATIGLNTFLKSSYKSTMPKRITLLRIKQAQKFFREFDLSELPREADEFPTHHAKRTKQKARQQAQEHLFKLWEGKVPKRMKDADVDLNRINQWLTNSGVKAENEGLIIATQDQSLATSLNTATSLKVALTHYVGCVARLMNLSITSYLAAQNLPKLNTFRGMITQHHTSIGRCARAMISRQLTNGTTTNQRLLYRTSNDSVEYANLY